MPAIAPYRIIRSQSGFVEGVVHLHGGQHIITCSYNGSPKLWDLESSTQIGDDWRDEGTNVGLKTIALSPKGDMIAGGSIDGTVMLWNIETGKVVRRWTGHTEGVKSLCWSPDGERVVSGAIDKTIKVWNIRSATPVLDLKTGQSVHAVSYSPKATKIATAGSNIKIWDIKTGKLLWTDVCSLASTLDDKTGKLLVTLKHIDVACSLAWTSDEKKLIAGDMRGSIRIFDTATWRQIALLDGHRGPVYAITLSRNDRLLVSASGDREARLWNLDTNFLVGPALQHEHFVTSAAFSGDGTLLSTGCADENAYVWNIYTILQATGLEDLLPVISLSDAPKSELKQNECASSHGSSQDIETQSFLEADATVRCPDPADELPPNFFDSMKGDVQSSTRPGAHPNFSAILDRFSSLVRRSSPNEVIETSESHPRALTRLSSFLHSPPNSDGISELPQSSQPPALARSSPHVLLGHLSLFLHYSRLHTGDATDPQQSQTPSGSRPTATSGRLSSLFSSPLKADDTPKRHLWTRQATSSRCSPSVVKVATLRDKQALYVSPPPRETAIDKAKRIKNPTWRVRVVLFLCCVSPGTNDTHGST